MNGKIAGSRGRRRRHRRRHRRRGGRASTWAASFAAAASVAMLAPPAIGDLIYQSGTLGSPGQSSGVTVNANTYQGVRFQVTDPATADRMGAHLGTPFPPSNILRGSLIQLSGPTDFPDSFDLINGPDVLATTTLTVPYGSNDVVSTFNPTPLFEGWYALVFFGQIPEFEAGCLAATNNPQVGTPSYFDRFSPGNWANTGNSGMRYFIASAGAKSWQESGGGSWSNYVNWSPGGAPASFDDTVFELGGATYTVTLSANGTVHDIANSSDHVTLALGGKTLLSTGTITVGLSVGQPVSLDVQNGILSRPTTQDIVLGVDRPGNMTLSNNALIDGYLESGLVVGKDNPGHLTVANAGVYTKTGRVADDQFFPAGTITGSGTATLNSGALWSVRQSFFAGRNGAAVVEVNSGAQLTVTATTKIYNSAGTEFRLQGGWLQTGSIDTSSNPSRFVWTSGTLTTTGPLTLSSSGPLGAGLPMTAGKTLFCTGGLIIAPGAGLGMNAGGTTLTGPVTNNGSFIQLGGNSTITGTNGLTGTGDLSVSGGTLLAARIRQQSLSMGGNGLIRLNVDSASAPNTSRLGALEILSGSLDLREKKLVVDNGTVGSWNGSAYTDITGLIQSGRNGGSWNGDGIITSQTNAATGNFTTIAVATAGQVKGISGSTTALWGGETVSAGDALIMYTYGGDATLDGKINIDDYVKIDSGIAGGLTGWANGDFNYDGKVNIDDYTTVIDANIGIQGPPFPTAGAVENSSGVVAVPEPGSVGLLSALGLATASMRRRRKG
jgi:hypothetical protein